MSVVMKASISYYDVVMKASELYPDKKVFIKETAYEFLSTYEKELEENEKLKEWILKQID